MKARRPRRRDRWNRPPSRPHSWPRTGATSSGPGRWRSRSAVGDLRQVFLRAARAWLRHDARRRAAPHPAVVAPGRRDHAHRDRRRAARVHRAPRRRRGRDRHHPQPQGDAVQGRARQDLHGPSRQAGRGRRHRRRHHARRRRHLPQPEPPHLHAVQGRQARDGAHDRHRPRLRAGRAPLEPTCRSARSRSTRCSRRSAR